MIAESLFLTWGAVVAALIILTWIGCAVAVVVQTLWRRKR
jgi:hypothetical protein